MYRRIRSPKQRFIRSFVSRQHFPAQRKGGGISKGGNLGSPLWLRAVRHALHRTSGSEKQTGYAQTTPTTIPHYPSPRSGSKDTHSCNSYKYFRINRISLYYSKIEFLWIIHYNNSMYNYICCHSKELISCLKAVRGFR